MEKKELKNLFIQLNAETSYLNKTYGEAEEKIKCWKHRIKQLKISRHDYAMMNHILNSRYENIQVLKEFHGKKELHSS